VAVAKRNAIQEELEHLHAQLLLGFGLGKPKAPVR
jgi:hypothetical protein